jgi:hypothetical protein
MDKQVLYERLFDAHHSTYYMGLCTGEEVWEELVRGMERCWLGNAVLQGTLPTVGLPVIEGCLPCSFAQVSCQGVLDDG